MVAVRRAYYGDLQLPKRLRAPVPKMSRGLVQWHEGVDQAEAIAFAQSPNYKRSWEMTTYWSPESPYEPEEFRDYESAIHDAWLARCERTDPLVVCQDIGITVQSYADPVVTATAAHGVIVGDQVLLRRNGIGLYTLNVLGVVGSTTTFEVAGGGHGILAGDQILRVDRSWTGIIMQDPPVIGLKEGRNHYEASAKWTFYGKPAATYRRTTVVLP